jgi:hypothetical protein
MRGGGNSSRPPPGLFYTGHETKLMALIIKVDSNTVPPAKSVPATQIQDAAAAQGNPFSTRAVGITKPSVHFETKQLNFETMANKQGTQFRFQAGTLPLTLSQEILISDALSSCAKEIWLAHEQGHVSDNESVMKQMEAELRKDADFADILLFPKWTPVGKNNENFTKAQKTIGERVGVVFQNLTTAAATARDTDAEYKRVQDEIKKKCP